MPLTQYLPSSSSYACALVSWYELALALRCSLSTLFSPVLPQTIVKHTLDKRQINLAPQPEDNKKFKEVAATTRLHFKIQVYLTKKTFEMSNESQTTANTPNEPRLCKMGCGFFVSSVSDEQRFAVP